MSIDSLSNNDSSKELLFDFTKALNTYDGALEMMVADTLDLITEYINSYDLSLFVSILEKISAEFSASMNSDNAIEMARKLLAISSTGDWITDEASVTVKSDDIPLSTKPSVLERIEAVASRYSVSIGVIIGLLAILVSVALEMLPDNDPAVVAELQQVREKQQAIIANQEAEAVRDEKIIELLTEIRDQESRSSQMFEYLVDQLEDTLNVSTESVSNSQDSVGNLENAENLMPEESLSDGDGTHPNEEDTSS